MYKKKCVILFEYILKNMARMVLWKQKPYIIAITGSVGKTTTKDLVHHVLSTKKSVFSTQKNYNTEIGVPITILCMNHYQYSFRGLMQVIYKWIWSLCTKKYPRILIIEMGVDRPRDMDYFMSFVHPDISILTTINYAHSAFFQSIEEIATEKKKIITKAKKKNIDVIINNDDPLQMEIYDNFKDKRHITMYGTTKDSTIFTTRCVVNFDESTKEQKGLSFMLHDKSQSSIIKMHMDNVIAKHTTNAVMIAYAVANICKLPQELIVKRIRTFVPEKGRMRLLRGVYDTCIIDDTYNASPVAMKAAIKTLHYARNKRKIVVIGDMRELGRFSQKSHELIADVLVDQKIDCVFFVGEEMTYAYNALIRKKTKQKVIKKYANAKDAVNDIVKELKKGDIVLIKGSRGMHMEHITRACVLDKTQTL